MFPLGYFPWEGAHVFRVFVDRGVGIGSGEEKWSATFILHASLALLVPAFVDSWGRGIYQSATFVLRAVWSLS